MNLNDNVVWLIGFSLCSHLERYFDGIGRMGGLYGWVVILFLCFRLDVRSLRERREREGLHVGRSTNSGMRAHYRQLSWYVWTYRRDRDCFTQCQSSNSSFVLFTCISPFILPLNREPDFHNKGMSNPQRCLNPVFQICQSY